MASVKIDNRQTYRQDNALSTYSLDSEYIKIKVMSQYVTYSE